MREKEESKNTKPVKPTPEQFGWQPYSSPYEEGGWMLEDGEDAFYKALDEWEKTEEHNSN